MQKKKSVPLSRSIVDLSLASAEEMKTTFEEIVKKQEETHAYFNHTLDTYSVNVFQNFYLNEIQPSLLENYHSHSYYEINYMYKGTCWQYVNGALAEMHGGDMLIMSMDCKHACYLLPDGLGRNLLIRKTFFDKIAAEYTSLCGKNILSTLSQHTAWYLFHTAESRILCALLDELYNYSYAILKPYTAMNANGDKLVTLALGEVLSLAEKNESSYESSIKKRKKKTADDFGAISQFIKENLATVKREDVEEYFGYSATSLCRIMKKNGTTFRGYLCTCREQQAILLLKNSTHSVTEIAKLLGFSSSENFCHFFKSRRNISPGDYRKAYLKSGLVDGTGDHGNYFF